MRIGTKIRIIIISVIIVLVAASFFLTIRLLEKIEEKQKPIYTGLVERSIKEKINIVADSIYFSIKETGEEALGLASLFSEDKDVVDAYRIALRGDIDDPESHESQEARDLLRRKFKTIVEGYKKQTGRSLLKIHFHLPNSRSLVRLWRDGYQTTVDGVQVDISDDLSSFRYTVNKINETPYSSITGIEIGRGGFVVRVLS